MRWLALALFGPLCFGQTALTRYSVEGGALAVVKDGRLVFARGYGLADAEAGQPVEPDAPTFTVLDKFAPHNGARGDECLRAITVRRVLHHTAGWDRSAGPAHDRVVGEGTVLVSEATGAAFPPTLDGVIRYALAQPLDFTPGARFAYSNFGYDLIGRVVENASGRPRADHVRESVLDPFGLPGVRQASTHRSGWMSPVRSYVSPGREFVPAPYGLLAPELGDSAGACVGSAIDLAKFMSMLDGSRPPAILTRDRFGAMLGRSQPPTWIDEPCGPALAWYHHGFAWLFNGDTAGGATLAVFGIDLGRVDSGPIVRLRDSSGVEHALDILYSSPRRINARAPASAASARPDSPSRAPARRTSWAKLLWRAARPSSRIL